MRKLLLAPLVLILYLLLVLQVGAQAASQAERGDPPAAALISVSSPDEAGVVTISGAAGAVFPTAQVAIRNLFTQETVYVNAGITGSFTAQLYGPGETPFLISPAPAIPTDLRGGTEAVPGGPGVIVYGANPVPSVAVDNVTQIRIDGMLDDWTAYPDAALAEGVYALLNAQSLYIAYDETLEEGAEFVVTFSVDDVSYELTVESSQPQIGQLQQVTPEADDVLPLSIATSIDNAIEVRIARDDLPFDGEITVDQVMIWADDETVDEQSVGADIVGNDEIDGVVATIADANAVPYYVAGPLAGSGAFWEAVGTISTLEPGVDETIVVTLDLTLRVPELEGTALAGATLLGDLTLQPVAIVDGERTTGVVGRHTNNGWSNLMTPSGLAIDNVSGDVFVSRVSVPAAQVIQQGDQIQTMMRFEFTPPPAMPDGLYVPVFSGWISEDTGDAVRWERSVLLGADASASLRRDPINRLPLVMRLGDVDEVQVPWLLFFDEPSDGSRGVMPAEDTEHYAISNRVRFNSPTYVLPPGDYALEPYMPNMLPNAADMTASPLVPLLVPGGRLQATVVRPSGTPERLSDAPIVQNQVSTDSLLERDLFGAQSPVDSYRLRTGSESYQAYAFDAYGVYEVELTGSVEDVFDNRYTGGGTYRILIAEPLDLTPGVLSGTPFFVGDVPFLGGRITPGVPAEVTVALKFHPLDGSDVVEMTFAATANRHGFFNIDLDEFSFDESGEYVIDYEARYSDSEGRLWAASLRSAGVVASEDATLLARGTRGLLNDPSDLRSAWLDTSVYPTVDTFGDSPTVANAPYFSGDVAYLPENVQSGLNGTLQSQDTSGAYANWLYGGLPEYVSPYQQDVVRLSQIDELPLRPVLGGGLTDVGEALLPGFTVNNAYAYFSAVRPDVSVRQFVAGSDNRSLTLHWDNNDPLNQQTGAGARGLSAGDYVFLFGGAVVKNAEANVRQIAPYAALAVITDEDEAMVVPPYNGAAGGPANGPLLDQGGETFFHLTGLQPGQILTLGEELAFAGQAAPTLQSTLDVIVTAPDGSETIFQGRTNDLGYFYDPAWALTFDQTGVWQVDLTITGSAISSAGQIDGELPTGTFPGLGESRFNVFVVESDAPPLTETNGDFDISYVPGGRFNFEASAPSEWDDDLAYYTVSTDAYLMDSGELQVFAGNATYAFDPVALAQDFPFEASGAGDGASGSDVVTVRMVITGTDADGDFQTRSRTFYMLHDRILTLDTLTYEN